MKHKTTSLEIISCISNMRSLSEKLLVLDRNYAGLLRLLLSDEFIKDGDFEMPTLKELIKKSGLTYSKINKQLQEFFYDLICHEHIGIDYCINDIEYVFEVRIRDLYYSFTYNNIPLLPRVGEHVSLPFGIAEIGCDFFYVDSIEHSFENDKQTTTISLRPGYYNKHLAMCKDEKYIKGYVSFEEYRWMDDYKWEERLRFRRS